MPLLMLIAAATGAEAANHGARPGLVGACVTTSVTTIGHRLEDGSTGKAIPGSGSTVLFANGIVLVSYDQMPAVDGSRKGDPVRLCLVSLPQNCPKGDDRGKIYKATNLRTRKFWTLPDSQHSCGGA